MSDAERYEAELRKAVAASGWRTGDDLDPGPHAEHSLPRHRLCVDCLAALAGPVVAAEVAAERERIAEAIEARIRPDDGTARRYGLDNIFYEIAARIARSGVVL